MADADKNSDGQRALGIGAIEVMEILRPVFDACSNPVVVVDRRARVAWSNRAFRQAGGTTEDALLRRMSSTARHKLWSALANINGGTAELTLEIEGFGPGLRAAKLTSLAPSAVVIVADAVSAEAQQSQHLQQALLDIAERLQDVGIGAARTDSRRPLPADLTDRQREVVELLFRSMSEGEIANVLFLSEHTVRNHKKAAFRRLDVHSKAELFTTYRANGSHVTVTDATGS